MKLNDIYEKVAQKNGVDVEEVKREMALAMKYVRGWDKSKKGKDDLDNFIFDVIRKLA